MSYLINEQPLLGLALLGAGTGPTMARGNITSPVWWLAALPTAGLIWLAVRTRAAAPALTGALRHELGPRMELRHTRPWPGSSFCP